MNIEELQDILKSKKIDITAREISSIWNMNEQSFSKKKKAKTAIKAKNIKQLEEYLKISLTPLSMPEEYQVAYKIINEFDNISMPVDTIAVDYYPDVFGSCGSGSFVFSEQKEILQVPRRCFQSFSDFRKYSIINATGDSMTPYICDRDRLIVEHWQGEQIRDNRIYIFRFGDNIFIKRLVLNLDQIIVKSDNKEYGVRYIEKKDADDFQIIGRIVGIWREEL